jgi:hypothetical protein
MAFRKLSLTFVQCFLRSSICKPSTCLAQTATSRSDEKSTAARARVIRN